MAWPGLAQRKSLSVRQLSSIACRMHQLKRCMQHAPDVWLVATRSCSSLIRRSEVRKTRLGPLSVYVFSRPAGRILSGTCRKFFKHCICNCLEGANTESLSHDFGTLFTHDACKVQHSETHPIPQVIRKTCCLKSIVRRHFVLSPPKKSSFEGS